jgi:hypothetical protein
MDFAHRGESLVVLGSAKRLFLDGDDMNMLKLGETKTFGTSILVLPHWVATR